MAGSTVCRRGQGIADAVLAEIVADGHLAAKAVAAVADGHLAAVVVEGVDEDGDVEAGPAQGVGDGAFVAEIRQGDEDAVNFVAMRLEQVGAFLGVGEGLDRAELGGVLGQGDGADALGFEDLEDVAAAGLAEVGGEEPAISDDEAEGGHGSEALNRYDVTRLKPSVTSLQSGHNCGGHRPPRRRHGGSIPPGDSRDHALEDTGKAASSQANSGKGRFEMAR